MLGDTIVTVITPSPYMANKIQQALFEIGEYQVIISNSPSEILELAEKSTFNSCIFDVFHPDFPVISVVKELKNKQPDLRLILILSKHGLSQQDIPGIDPDGFLPRSFNTAQLINALGQARNKIITVEPSAPQPDHTNSDSLTRETLHDQETPKPHPFSITQDVTNLTHRLSDLSTETTALAIIILRRKQLIAHRDKFPLPALQEFVDLINSYSKTSAKNLQKVITTDNQKTGNWDVVRSVELQSIQGKYLLYVINLTREMLLAMVFDQDTQFSFVRRQTIQIAHELLEPQHGSSLEYSPTYPEFVKQEPSQFTKTDQFDWIPESLKDQLAPLAHEPLIDTPQDKTRGNLPLEVITPGAGKDETGTEFSANVPIPKTTSEETSIVYTTLEQDNNPGYHDITELDDQISGEPLGLVTTVKEPTDQADSGNETNSSLSPSSSGYYITYSFLLIPRMPEHLLMSNLASFLFKWMGQLCLAYGWRLEHLSIHPNYIQMITEAPLTISPAHLIRTLRQKTSQYIFTQFPPLTNENPSGDFWAPGFFITGGKHAVQPHLIDRYISEIREHQGVNNSTSYK
jgi:DNA-binding NarL/FixJ family response regulator/REP element-mobilizing transposase RayT